jgi:hypothetical protein
MKNSSLVILFIVFLFSFNAKAQQFNPNVSGAAFADLYLGNGEVTKEQYDDFWNGVGVKSRQEKEIVVTSMRNNFLLIQEHQIEVWACAQKAWESRKVPKCSNLEKKFKLLSASMNKSGQKDSITKIKDSSKSIIKTAATRGIYKLDGGAEMRMSLELIKNTRSNLGKLFSRFDKVLRMDYNS